MTLTGRTIVRRTGAVIGAVVILAGAFLAGRGSVSSVSAASGADLPGQADQQTVWTVQEESVGRSLSFTGQISVSSNAGPVARSEGVITAVHVDRPQRVTAGSLLYSVNLRPVVAGVGALPAFRPLRQGDQGADVAQLRDFLCDSGYRGACGEATLFDSALAEAVRAWQRDLGVPPDGVVGVGDILWFSSLPARLRPTEALAVGQDAPHNTRPYTVDEADPVLRIPVSQQQAALVAPQTPATVAGAYEAVVAQAVPAGDDPGAEFHLLVTAGQEQPFCAVHDVCADLLGDKESTTVEVEVHTVPQRTGPVVPVAAVETDPTGRTLVRLPDGTRREVTVLAAAGGVVVVDGLRPGDQVVIP